ncbi:DUF4177 domain-containing protein [Paludisphaera soli]|uniref:DUF4177 domain-containing protein n=1 Tax=Paludisphaera soli TaxID=2712865 RepID=UPI00197EDAB1|nr:DUF4177 domain-containing protein [Paludisphaera soli]
MLHIACPSCGERGKIPVGLVGARLKCKKCGGAFQVAAPEKAHAAVGAAAAHATPSPASQKEYEGIAVEGLDAAAWSLAPDQSSLVLPAVAHHEPPPPSPSSSMPTTTTAAVADHPPDVQAPAREYKLLTSKDRIFEGKFDLTRLEDAINHYAKLGWVAKSMCLPHVKNFQGAMQEEVVVLLER